MAKTYQSVTGTNAKTRDGEVVFVNGSNQHRIAELFSKETIAKNVKAGVWKEFDDGLAPTNIPPQTIAGDLEEEETPAELIEDVESTAGRSRRRSTGKDR